MHWWTSAAIFSQKPHSIGVSFSALPIHGPTWLSSLPKLRTPWKVNNLRYEWDETSRNAANFADAQNRVWEVLPTVGECIKVRGD